MFGAARSSGRGLRIVMFVFTGLAATGCTPRAGEGSSLDASRASPDASRAAADAGAAVLAEDAGADIGPDAGEGDASESVHDAGQDAIDASSDFGDAGPDFVADAGTRFGAPHLVRSSISVTPGRLPADRASTARVTVTLRDVAGLPVAGARVFLSGVAGHLDVHVPSGTTDAAGVFSSDVSSYLPGRRGIAARFTAGTLSTSVEFTDTGCSAVPAYARDWRWASSAPSPPFADVSANDFDSDGELDFVTMAGPLGIHIAESSWFDYALSSGPAVATMLATGNFDGDADADVLSVGSYGLRFYQNEVGGTWPVETVVTTESDGAFVGAEVADFDDDGAQDVLAWGAANSFIVVTDRLRHVERVSLPGRVIAATVADLDRDGIRDVALVLLFRAELAFFRGVGDGTFVPMEATVRAPGANVIVAGDFDGDGQADLAVAGHGSGTDVWIVPHEPSGSFSAPVVRPLGCNPSSLVAEDFDQDGRMDLAAGCFGVSEVRFFMHAGDGTSLDDFSVQRNLATHYAPARLEYVSARTVPSLDAAALIVTTDLDVQVFAHPGDGGFASTISSTGAAQSLATADFDRDGRIDVAMANATGAEVAVVRWADDMMRPRVARYDVGAGPNDLAVLDLERDGAPDLVVADYTSSQISVMRNLGDGTFAAARQLGAPAGPHGIAAGDVDGDGDADVLVVALTSNRLAMYRNDGTGALAAPLLFETRAQPTSVSLLDADADGDLDAMVAFVGDGTTSGAVSWMRNDGAGTFVRAADFAAGSGAYDTAVADFDEDGRGDFAASYLATESLSVGLSRAGGRFAVAAVRFDRLENVMSIGAGDFNGDGHADLLATAGYPRSLLLFAGRGDGTFASPVREQLQAMEPHAIALGDVDGDGRPDVVFTDVARGSESLHVWRGMGCRR